MQNETKEGGGEGRDGTRRLVAVVLDDNSLVHTNADIEHERRVAIFDLLEDNVFAPVGAPDGPYRLTLAVAENRLVFDIRHEDERPLTRVVLPIRPLRRIVKDYFLMCESYYNAIRKATAQQIEAIDMGRRALHNEGSELLMETLDGKIATDHDTARRLFTLLCVLHFKG